MTVATGKQFNARGMALLCLLMAAAAASLLTWGRTILTDRKKLAEKMVELAGPPTVSAINIPTPPAIECRWRTPLDLGRTRWLIP